MERAAPIQTDAAGAREVPVYTGAARLAWPMLRITVGRGDGPGKERAMNNVFYIIGVVVVVLAILGYFGFR